jgi:hypothetical protein
MEPFGGAEPSVRNAFTELPMNEQSDCALTVGMTAISIFLLREKHRHIDDGVRAMRFAGAEGLEEFMRSMSETEVFLYESHPWDDLKRRAKREATLRKSGRAPSKTSSRAGAPSNPRKEE